MMADSAARSSADHAREARLEEFRHYSSALPNGQIQYVLSSPFIHCGGCISIIEKELAGIEGVDHVRVNLTLKRITLVMSNADASPLPAIERLDQLGYKAVPVELGDHAQEKARQQSSRLLRAVAISGFAAMNIMLLSVSTWSGAEGSTRDLFHLVSALIAIPTVAYCGQVFFQSAFKALKNRHLNMDVPISLAVLLAIGMSLFETLNHGEVAYFDAVVSLLFFLLIGRYLDQLMRERARNAVSGLSKLAMRTAAVIGKDGSLDYKPIDEIRPGMHIRILPGGRIPVDGHIMEGESDLDLSLVTGESAPCPMRKGDAVQAGTHNLTGTIDIMADKTAAKSFLAEVSQMLEAAENGRGGYVRVADRMARIYAPAVHLLALAAFLGWMWWTGGDWQTSIYVAISVLIITCPCALGLAVPVVHVVGAAKLFEYGILMKDGSALERLSETNHIVFDKTGTLTTQSPEILDADISNHDERRLIKSLALHSSHPASQAIAGFLDNVEPLVLEDVREISGKGVEGSYENKKMRLGMPDWVCEITKDDRLENRDGVFFARKNGALSRFGLSEALRKDAVESVTSLKSRKLPIEIISGDHPGAVDAIASRLGIDNFLARMSPRDKIERISELHESGSKVLMVGDGLNDAPALASGHASMAPASASDVGRNAADFVFTRNSLAAVPFALTIAEKARNLIRQNFALAIAYNCIAVPLAVTGHVTPLIAAIAMSASSILVVINSMRLSRSQDTRRHASDIFGRDKQASYQERTA